MKTLVLFAALLLTSSEMLDESTDLMKGTEVFCNTAKEIGDYHALLEAGMEIDRALAITNNLNGEGECRELTGTFTLETLVEKYQSAEKGVVVVTWRVRMRTLYDYINGLNVPILNQEWYQYIVYFYIDDTENVPAPPPDELYEEEEFVDEREA